VTNNKSVFGIYLTRSNVESAVNALKDAGFSNSDVSILLPETVKTADLATENTTKAPEGAAVGAGSGAALGGALGWLVGVGALAIPGIGPVVAAGPLLAALAGVGIGGALGGFAGSLVGMGIPESEAKKYEGKLLKGGILVAVHCETEQQVNRAKEVLQSSGAQDIAVSRETASQTENAA
jgi:rhodanese-related sulfurtransferase